MVDELVVVVVVVVFVSKIDRARKTGLGTGTEMGVADAWKATMLKLRRIVFEKRMMTGWERKDRGTSRFKSKADVREMRAFPRESKPMILVLKMKFEENTLTFYIGLDT